MTTTPAMTLTDPELLRCPFAAYKALRDDSPAYLDPVTGLYIVTRYEDIRKIASNPLLFSNDTRCLANRETEATPEIQRIFRDKGLPEINTLVTNDPPSHKKYRSLVDHAFRVSRIEQIQPYIEAVARDLVAKLAGKSSCEFVSELAIPMPVLIIADQLGVPRERAQDIKRWSDALLTRSDPLSSTATQIAAAESTAEMQQYFVTQLAHYRDNPANNIISDLTNAEIDGRPLEDAETVSLIAQLMAAGNETTTNTMALGMEMLIRDNLEDTLRQSPELIPNFVEEILRLSSPLQGLFRRATADTEINGVKIPEGAVVMLRWAAGNRDERRFDQPEGIVLDRPNPGQHLAFGFGIHFCVGNALARAELRTVFRVLLEDLKNFRLTGEPELIIHGFARGLSRLELAYERGDRGGI